ncbi:hypothetical protein HRG_001210 [Hirsutella rhossiliensis]|uniref:Uncharacterized protein n=1 Tax=Hirsutella rhossiliensis TaxID=111463 RepID=A0A9P8SMG7_9HYPO|nr:uncharacterized protein HRG_01210 [Hirsutella rhossiliensis]KAH0968568.1 hypothetical protein HRG_01210 [Hirsutella rhossiliensis]
MRSIGSIIAGLCVVGLAVAAPPPSPGRPPQILTCHGPVTTSGGTGRVSLAPPVPSSSPTGRADCAPGGKCDCTRIVHKNSEEYFQCVTDPDCEKCRAEASTRISRATSRSTASPSFSNTTTDYRTVTPGTYTVTASNVVSVIVVPVPPERTPEPATPPLSSPSASLHVVTIVETTVVTVGPTPMPTTAAESAPATVSSSEDAGATTVQDEAKCPAVCNCVKIKDKKSPDPPPKSSSTSTATTTSPAKPKPSCPDYCDCSKIKDKQSDEYFQCTTNPNCEKCRGGRR